MHQSSSKTKRSMKQLGGVMLALWLGGAGCLFGCQAHATSVLRPGGATPLAAAAHHMMGGHACCRAAAGRQRNSQIRNAEALTSDSNIYCPMAGQRAGVASKVRLFDVSPQAAASAAYYLNSLPPVVGTARAASTLRDRGSTYLRCCVLLI
jgi:hypothetical protein